MISGLTMRFWHGWSERFCRGGCSEGIRDGRTWTWNMKTCTDVQNEFYAAKKKKVNLILQSAALMWAQQWKTTLNLICTLSNIQAATAEQLRVEIRSIFSMRVRAAYVWVTVSWDALRSSQSMVLFSENRNMETGRSDWWSAYTADIWLTIESMQEEFHSYRSLPAGKNTQTEQLTDTQYISCY